MGSGRRRHYCRASLADSAMKMCIPVCTCWQKAELHKVISQSIIFPVHHVQCSTYQAPACVIRKASARLLRLCRQHILSYIPSAGFLYLINAADQGTCISLCHAVSINTPITCRSRHLHTKAIDADVEACLRTPVWMSPIMPKSMYASLLSGSLSRFPGCGSA